MPQHFEVWKGRYNFLWNLCLQHVTVPPSRMQIIESKRGLYHWVSHPCPTCNQSNSLVATKTVLEFLPSDWGPLFFNSEDIQKTFTIVPYMASRRMGMLFMWTSIRNQVHNFTQAEHKSATVHAKWQDRLGTFHGAAF